MFHNTYILSSLTKSTSHFSTRTSKEKRVDHIYNKCQNEQHNERIDKFG